MTPFVVLDTRRQTAGCFRYREPRRAAPRSGGRHGHQEDLSSGPDVGRRRKPRFDGRLHSLGLRRDDDSPAGRVAIDKSTAGTAAGGGGASARAATVLVGVGGARRDRLFHCHAVGGRRQRALLRCIAFRSAGGSLGLDGEARPLGRSSGRAAVSARARRESGLRPPRGKHPGRAPRQQSAPKRRGDRTPAGALAGHRPRTMPARGRGSDGESRRGECLRCAPGAVARSAGRSAEPRAPRFHA